MVRASERVAPRLFATLVASSPPRTLHVTFADLCAAAVVHFAVLGVVIWLSTRTAAPALALGNDVNTLMFADNAALVVGAVDGSRHADQSMHRVPAHAAAHGFSVEMASVPMIADLTEVVSSVAQHLDDVIAATVGQDLINAAADQLGVGLARDTVHREPTIEELEKGVTLTTFTQGPQLLNKRQIADILEDRFPRNMIALDMEGLTVLWLLIDKEGKVHKSAIAESSGHKLYDRAALDAVPSMKFRPAYNNGVVTAVWVRLPVRFRVEE